MRAIVLAAGEGSRLRPLTATRPKPMVEVGNRPVLHYVVDALVANGVKDITLVVGYHRERVQAYFEDGRKFGARIDYAFQSALLGTAHALSLADLPKEPFLTLGGDNVVNRRLVADVLAAEGDIVLAAKQSESPSKYGVLHLEGNEVRRIEEKPPGAGSVLVNTGVYRFPGDFERAFRPHLEKGQMGLTHVLNALIAESRSVRAIASEGAWLDALYPWDLLTLNAHVLAHAAESAFPSEGAFRSVDFEPPVAVGEDVDIGPHSYVTASSSIGDNVTIGAKTVIENSIIHDDAQIGPGSIIQNSVIGAGARIGPRFTSIAGPSTARTVDGHHDLKDFGCVVGEDAWIGGAVTVAPGVLIANRARIQHRKFIAQNIDEGAIVL